MNNRFTLVIGLALVVLPGCSQPSGGVVDAATSDAFGGVDAAPVDAARVDSGGGGSDAGMRDAAPPPDAGPLLPDRDAGNPFGDAGPEGKPAWVTIDVLTDGSTCEPLVACGGDEVGTWDVSGGCVEVPVPPELMRCPTATVTAVGRARGRVTFTGTTAIRTAQSEVLVSIYIPGICAAFAGGCSAVETMIQGQFPDSACREDDARDCLCEIRQDYVIDDADAYTIEGNQIVSAALGKRWDYCVEADGNLRYQDVSDPGTVLEPGIIELTPR